MSPQCRARNCLRFVLTVLKALIFRFKQGGAVSAESPYHLTQHATRCSDSSGQAQEYLIARHAAVETETVLVQISLELGAPSVICSLKECVQITDYLVYPIPFATADAGKGLSPYWTDRFLRQQKDGYLQAREACGYSFFGCRRCSKAQVEDRSRAASPGEQEVYKPRRSDASPKIIAYSSHIWD